MYAVINLNDGTRLSKIYEQAWEAKEDLKRYRYSNTIQCTIDKTTTPIKPVVCRVKEDSNE